MKTVCHAIGIAGLFVFSGLGQNANTEGGKPAGLVPPPAPGVTQSVIRATKTRPKRCLPRRRQRRDRRSTGR